MGIWLHTHTVNTTNISPDLGELAEILGDPSVQTMPLCFGWGCRTCQTTSHIHVIHINGVWAPSTALDGHNHGCTVTPSRCFPIFVRVVEILGNMRVQPMLICNGWGCRTCQPYIHKVFEHLHLLWMVIWLHTHTILTTDISPDLRELGHILGDESVQTIVLCHSWDCRTFQTASRIHIHIKGVLSCSFNCCGWAYGCTLLPLPPQTCPQIWESSWLKSKVNVSVATMQLCYDWGCRTFQTASHIHTIHT